MSTKAPAQHHDDYTPEKIHAQNLPSLNESNTSHGLPNVDGKFGGMGGNIDRDSVLPGNQGIDLGIANLDGIFSCGSAFDSNPFEDFLGDSMAPAGLLKPDMLAIKSLGNLTSIDNVSFVKQSNATLAQNTAFSSKGMQQGG